MGHSGWNLTHPGADHLDPIRKIYSKLPGADYRVKVKESRVETETLGYYNVIGYVYRTAEIGKGRVANARKETKRMSAERSISYTMGSHYRSRGFSYALVPSFNGLVPRDSMLCSTKRDSTLSASQPTVLLVRSAPGDSIRQLPQCSRPPGPEYLR